MFIFTGYLCVSTQVQRILQNLIPDLFKTDSKCNLSFYCIPDNSGWLDDEISSIQIPTTNEERFAKSVRKGMASISEELGELCRNVENRRRENAFWKIEPRITQFLHNDELEPSVTFRKLGALSTALAFHQRAMKVRMYYQDKIGIANSYNNLGIVLRKMGHLKSARKRVRKAFRLRHEMSDALNMSRNLSSLRNIETALRVKRVASPPYY
ncbi:MAG: tetratricopeptide repeat protein [Acidobacteriota bacterium]